MYTNCASLEDFEDYESYIDPIDREIRDIEWAIEDEIEHSKVLSELWDSAEELAHHYRATKADKECAEKRFEDWQESRRRLSQLKKELAKIKK